MEAVKNRLTSVRRNARTFVVDADSDLLTDTGDGDLDQPSRRRKAHRVVDDRIDRSNEPVGLAHDHCRIFAWAGEGEPRVAGLSPSLPTVDQLLDQHSEVDALKGSARQLRIRARSFTDVADQTVEP